MPHISKVVLRGVPSLVAFPNYVGPRGELALDPQSGALAFHDGSTPGGSPLGGLKVAPPVQPTATNGPPSVVLVPNAYNVIVNVGQSNDGVLLPPAKAGTVVVVFGVFNSNQVAIMAGGSDTIVGQAGKYYFYGAASSTSPANVTKISPVLIFVCQVNGDWLTNGVPT